jgi:Phosphotransferase system cellobiose-specific component IIC
MPPIISGFLATNSFMGSALQAFNLVIDILIYLPFLMAQNKQQKIQEAAADGIDLTSKA